MESVQLDGSASSASASAPPPPSINTTDEPDSPFPLTVAGNKPYDYRDSTIADDRAAALEVEKRIKQRKKDDRKAEEQRAVVHEDNKPLSEDELKDQAAKIVQGSYRSHITSRTSRGLNLSSSARWSDGIQTQKLKRAGSDQDQGKNDTSSRWQRSQVYAQQISTGQEDKNDTPEMSEGEEMDKFAKNDKEREQIKKERLASKNMEGQYWLEMVDEKHRYGTNLKWYHQRWNETSTSDNFFHWLDFGSGLNLSLPQCPRPRLEKERITYLTAEQRRNYLVRINDRGLLVWARNGEEVDTTKWYRDGRAEVGVVRMSEQELREVERRKAERRRRARETGDSSSSSSSSDSDGQVVGYADKGGTAGQGRGIKQFKARVNYYLSPRAVMDRLLRETIANNTWLYVSDMQNNLFVAIKKTGSFQHSSFLYGSRVTSAGLIQVDKGKLTSLSPLSGHYRAGTMHFKAFVRSLAEQGADMSSVSISKALFTIGAIEKFVQAQKRKKRVTDTIKSALHLGKTKEEEKHEIDVKDSREGSRGVTRGEEGREELPGEGMGVEEMSEEVRMERGVRLVQRAFERSLKLRDEEEEEEEE